MLDGAPCQELGFFREHHFRRCSVPQFSSKSIPITAEEALDGTRDVRYSWPSNRAICVEEYRDRDVNLYRNFAFTYRFLFWRRRAGETGASELID